MKTNELLLQPKDNFLINVFDQCRKNIYLSKDNKYNFDVLWNKLISTNNLMKPKL